MKPRTEWLIEADGYALAVRPRSIPDGSPCYYLTRQWSDENILGYKTQQAAEERLIQLYQQLGLLRGRECRVVERQFDVA